MNLLACPGLLVAALYGSVICGVSSSCSAEELHVLLINSNNGEPMARQPIGLYLGRDDRSYLEQITASDGVAIFQLSSPVVDWVTVGNASQTVWHCSPPRRSTFRTSEIFEHGVVAPNTCDKKGKRKIEAKPGEVVLFARPLRWFKARSGAARESAFIGVDPRL